MISENDIYVLRHQEERDRRRELLTGAHIQPLCDYVQALEAALGDECKIPSFDPCDGGVNARVLLLLETPGLKAHHSGFVSRNNPDMTARNLLETLEQAGIDRKETLIWNVVPAYIGSEKQIERVNAKELKSALPLLENLLALLPSLEAIVMLGKTAQQAKPLLTSLTPVRLFMTCHPSQVAFNRWKGLKQKFNDDFISVAEFLSSQAI